MIRLGLRLTLSGGREAAARLAVTAAAVALGVGLLLITLAGINALNAQNARAAWLSTGAPGSGQRVRERGHGGRCRRPDPLWWLLSADYFGSLAIGRVDVAATGPSSPVPPGIPRLPGPGQFYASPALSRLLRSTPAAELGDRFPGHQIGTIGPAALPAPNSLIIVIGHTPWPARPHARRPAGHQHPGHAAPAAATARFAGLQPDGLELILAVGALALLFPVLDLHRHRDPASAARREQRFAAMRLVGATPRQVSVISAVESTVAAVVGVAVGFGLFFLLRPALAHVPFTGAPFFPATCRSAWPTSCWSRSASRRARRRRRGSRCGGCRSPRSASPGGSPRPRPRAWRLIPLLAGIGRARLLRQPPGIPRARAARLRRISRRSC